MTDARRTPLLRIKKYPNRRFYDTTRSHHVTLDDLYHLVREGHEIEVHDADGRDITNLVLMQIMLEHDPPKLDLFPATLLHQAIQANQQMVRRFVDEYFSRAMDAFVASREQFDEFLARAGLSPLRPMTPFDWARMFLRGFDQEGGPPAETEPTPGPAPEAEKQRDDPVASLREQVEALSAELNRLKARRPPTRKKKSKTKTGTRAGKKRTATKKRGGAR